MTTNHTTPLRLLVAEDHSTILFALRNYFEPRGWSVVCKSTLAAATKALGEVSFDLAILDLRLGDDAEAGILLARHITERHLPTRVLLLTAYGSKEIHARALEAGVDAVLDKPMSLAHLHDLAQWLARGAAVNREVEV